MQRRFTERARHTVLLAQIEAEKAQKSLVDREHLLLGLLMESEGKSALILRKMNFPLEDAELVLRANIAAKSSSPQSNEQPKLTSKAKRILELAAAESRKMRHNHIGTEHLLLALLHGRDNVAESVLKVRAREVRAVIRESFEGEENTARPEQVGKKPRTLWDVLRRR